MSLYQCSTKHVTTSEVNWPFNVFPSMFIDQHVIKDLKVHAMHEHLLIQGI